MGALKDIDNIAFKNVCVRHDKNVVFDNVDFECPMHEVVSIQGPRGSGKSSFLKLLSGLLLPESGSCYINDNPVSEMSFEEFVSYRLNIGYSFDYGGLLNNMSIFQNLMLPLKYHNMFPGEAKKRVLKYLEIFGLMDVRNDRPPIISGGMRKEACVARSFILEPEVLVLDDPTTGMSVINKEYFRNLIKDRMENGNLKHVFISTDDPFVVEGLVTKMLFIKDKNITVFI